jgi:hypothetical protein
LFAPGDVPFFNAASVATTFFHASRRSCAAFPIFRLGLFVSFRSCFPTCSWKTELRSICHHSKGTRMEKAQMTIATSPSLQLSSPMLYSSTKKPFAQGTEFQSFKIWSSGNCPDSVNLRLGYWCACMACECQEEP